MSETSEERIHKIGEYYADYSELTPEELAKTDPEMEEILRRSKVISTRTLIAAQKGRG